MTTIIKIIYACEKILNFFTFILGWSPIDNWWIGQRFIFCSKLDEKTPTRWGKKENFDFQCFV